MGWINYTGGWKPVSRGVIHDVRLLWHQHAQDEYWGFLLIDGHNVFNN